MSRPLLFQNAEPNISNEVTMVTFQKEDHHHIIARQATIKEELCRIIAEGEEEKLFIDPAVGIWFGGVHRNKFGQILNTHENPNNKEYSQHINHMLNSPPKKQAASPVQPPTKIHQQSFIIPTSNTTSHMTDNPTNLGNSKQ